MHTFCNMKCQWDISSSYDKFRFSINVNHNADCRLQTVCAINLRCKFSANFLQISVAIRYLLKIAPIRYGINARPYWGYATTAATTTTIIYLLSVDRQPNDRVENLVSHYTLKGKNLLLLLLLLPGGNCWMHLVTINQFAVSLLAIFWRDLWPVNKHPLKRKAR